jgi:vancomycin resistance protein YoaR
MLTEQETQMMTRLIVAGSIVLMLMAGPSQRNLSAQATAPQPQAQSNMQEMMKMHEQMMAEMKAADARLDALVKEMNTATGNAKINGVAAVVNELVRQHKAMHEHMGQMHQHMMGGRGMMMKK